MDYTVQIVEKSENGLCKHVRVSIATACYPDEIVRRAMATAQSIGFGLGVCAVKVYEGDYYLLKEPIASGEAERDGATGACTIKLECR